MASKDYPNKQFFNIAPKKNVSKKRAWWQLGRDNNPKVKKVAE